MILNNYRAIRLISQLKNELLTPDLIFTLHRTITEGTLPEGAEQNKTRKSFSLYRASGSFRKTGSVVRVA